MYEIPAFARAMHGCADLKWYKRKTGACQNRMARFWYLPFAKYGRDLEGLF